MDRSHARTVFREAVERVILAGTDRRAVVAEARALSARYRGDAAGPQARRPDEVVAYAASRLPATHAAILHVLGSVVAELPGWEPRSVLDVGAGPGTASWAAFATIGSITHVEMVEREPAMIEAGRRLAEQAPWPALRTGPWRRGGAAGSLGSKADVVIAAYVLGELDTADARAAVAAWWEAAHDVVIIVEPGTPAGFARVREARAALVAAGASLVAPCPHQSACPIEGRDWCHFAARIERSRLQREIKAGARGYEDEKFSYVAAARSRVAAGAGGRVLQSRHGGGRVRLKVCTTEGTLLETTVGRRLGDDYRRARRARWGDRLVLEPGARRTDSDDASRR